MTTRKLLMVASAGFLLSLFMPPLYALDKKEADKPKVGGESSKLIGVWEITKTKEPGKPYLTSFQGRPFVSKGPNAFTLILEYRPDGTFRRLCRLGDKESVEDGQWTLSGHELRQRPVGSRNEEVMYVRFDGPDQYTSVEVFEDTVNPGLFAQFQKKTP